MKIQATVVSPTGLNTYPEEVAITCEKIGVQKQIRFLDANGYTTLIPVGTELIDALRWMLRDTRD